MTSALLIAAAVSALIACIFELRYNGSPFSTAPILATFHWVLCFIFIVGALASAS